MIRWITVIGSLLLSSCMVGPDYVRPKDVVPAHFKETKGQWQTVHPQDANDKGAWWLVFHDPLLNDLERQLNQFNQTIIQAEATYRQSLAIVDEARAALFPSLVGASSVFRQRQAGGTSSSLSTVNGSTSTTTSTSNTILSAAAPTISIYSAMLSASWEPDIWGQVRRTIASDLAAAQANEALWANIRLSSQSSLAQYYFELRTLDLDQSLLDGITHDYQKILRLVENQYASGVASRAEIVQAQIQFETAKAQAINNGILRGQYEHAIAVLIGKAPANLSLKVNHAPFKVPRIPVSVPSLLLERRPDIAQSERLMQNTSELIGVAIANYYPSLTLTGVTTAVGTSLHQLVHTPILSWSTGVQMAETLYDGGLRQATVNATKQAYIASVANYRQTVLAAFQDVEDNLVSVRLLSVQNNIERQAAAHAALALQLVRNQYDAGTVDPASILNAQIAAYNAQKTVNDISGLQMTSAVGLIKSLGGSW